MEGYRTMATANFKTQSDFDLYVIDFEPLSEEEQKQKEAQTGPPQCR